MNLLLVEDERPLAMAIHRIFAQNGIKVTWVEDGETGYDSAQRGEYDVIVLDVMLPRMNGWEVCERLRKGQVHTPILMLTALDEVDDRVKGLTLGADDYLSKPFAMPELLARVNALFRRDKVNRGDVIRIADLEIDRQSHRVVRSGKEITLTRREYDLLEALALNEGRVLTREAILERVWRDEETYSNTVDVFIGTLRKKVDAPFAKKLIHTAIGFGYVIRTEGV